MKKMVTALKICSLLSMPFLFCSCMKIFNFSKSEQTPLQFSEFSSVYSTTQIENVSTTSLKQDSLGNIYALAQLGIFVAMPNDVWAFNSQPHTSYLQGMDSGGSSYLLKYAINGTNLQQTWLDIPTFPDNLPYIKTPALNFENSTHLLMFGNLFDNQSPIENFYISSLDLQGNRTNHYTDNSSVSLGGTMRSLMPQIVTAPSGKHFTVASLNNEYSSLSTLSIGTAAYTINEFDTLSNKSAISVTVGGTNPGYQGRWLLAAAKNLDSNGNWYLAQPSPWPASSSEIEIYKVNTNHFSSLTSPLLPSQTFDMTTLLSSTPFAGHFNANRTNYFQIYVDNHDNVYLYGTIPLGTSPYLYSYPAMLPSPLDPNDYSIGFIAKLDPNLTVAPNITFIYDSAVSPNIENQNISVNDLAEDNAGSIYAIGDFYPTQSPALFNTTSNHLVGTVSSFVAKYASSSIGTASAQPSLYKFVDYQDVKAKTNSLLVFAENEVYLSGSVETSVAPRTVFGSYALTAMNNPYFFLSAQNLLN